MASVDGEQLIRALRDPAAWPGAEPGPIDLRETHISRVLLGRDRVLKLKRPVQFSFVDYSTLGKRRQACLDEVRLNRLLADGIYLGIVPILRDGERLRIGDEGERGDVVEWGTWMRRIDDREMLDDRLLRGDVPPDFAGRIADRLVPFHRSRPPVGQDDPDATLDMLLAVVTENLAEVGAFSGNPLPPRALVTIDRSARAFIATQRASLRQRVVDGWAREGHGDLRCEHVIVPATGPVQVFDCVEFNRELRIADVASDLGFLLMDLARLGAPAGTIPALLDRYRAAGIDLPVGLLRLFWIHRALVRAKVHCLRLADLHGDAWLAVARKAVDYVHVAYRQAVSVRPVVIAMTGLSGTGKSTVAGSIARALGAETVIADVVRKRLAGTEGNTSTPWGEGIYTPEWTERTYGALLDAAREHLAAGRPVVIDATFLEPALRERAAAVAREAGAPFVLAEVTCDEAVVVRRLAARQRAGTSVSDATADVYRRQRQRMAEHPPSLPAGAIHVRVDTTPHGPVSIDPVLRGMEDAGVVVPGIREDGVLA